MRHYIRLLAITLVGVISGCEPYDQLMGGSSPNYGGYNNNGNYPYNSYNSRYPSNGYETEYRKAQQQINSANSQAIVSGITQRMLNGGWYPEGTSGNQLIFTRERNSHDQEIYYKTVYTLVPSGAGYRVYANMKLKTVGSPYSGSLDDAAHNVDDRTESILKMVRREVEQQSVSVITPVPTQVTKKPYSDLQKKWHYYDQPRLTPSEQTSTHDAPAQTVVEPEGNYSNEQTVNATSTPNVAETNIVNQQEQTQKPADNYQTKQQIKKERTEKAKERKEQAEETRKEKHQQQKDNSNDQQSTQDENTVTKEPEASQQ